MRSIRAVHAALVAIVGVASIAGCGSAVEIPGDGPPDSSPVGDAYRDTTLEPDGEIADSTVGDAPIVIDTPVVDTPTCKGLACKQVDCGTKPTTTVTGTVYAPNGTMPIYNATVYVPNAPVGPMPAGVQCDRCGNAPSGEPIVIALTDAKGHFELKNVPVDKDVPLVIQLGKWRRITKIPSVTACVENPITDTGITRLPKNQSEGSMPKIAVTVGGCDKVACLLPKIGIDSSEFGVDGSAAAVHFYLPSFGSSAGPPGMKDARVLWNHPEKLKEYDLAIFSCECAEAAGAAPGGSKDETSFAAVDAYLKAGGRLLTTDFQYLWYKKSPDAAMRSVVTIPGGAPSGTNPVSLVSSFPKGKALSDWLAYIDPTTKPGKVTCDYVFNNLTPADPTKSRVWGSSTGIDGAAGTTDNPRFLTINAPVGVPSTAQCGKAVHLDAHINSSDSVDATFPLGCTAPIKQGEEAFAFFLFDLNACIQDDSAAPVTPPLE